MTELIDTYENARKNFNHILDDLYIELGNAGIGTEGEIKNKIKKTERDIEELDKKITAEGKRTSGNKKTDIHIYIVCARASRIKKALLPELYKTLQKPIHDDRDCRNWIPFSNENYKITDIIDKLRNDGHQFQEFYLEGKTAIELLARIDRNIKNSVAIIDLLAIDDENRPTVIKFNRIDVCQVITPIDSYLPNPIKDYMTKKRMEVFDLLEYYLTQNGGLDIYQPETAGRLNLLQVLMTIISKKTINYNTIADENSDHSQQLRTLTNSSL